MTTTPLAADQVILLNKPFQVLCQFSAHEGKTTLAEYIDLPDIYPAGRLDYDSEGLLLLTGNGQLQHRLTDPRHKLAKTYWVQVEGNITDQAISQLCSGVQLKDGPTLPAQALPMDPPASLWERNPPIRQRANIPTSWLQLTISEGRNRQVRRMTAAVGFPTLRLIRYAIGPWTLEQLKPGETRFETVPAELLKPVRSAAKGPRKPGANRPGNSVKRGRSHQRSRAR